jgi:hypothetical protein
MAMQWLMACMKRHKKLKIFTITAICDGISN